MKKPKERKKLRRDQIKHPALNKNYNSRILSEYIDYDYLDQLSEEELDWLNKFTEEFHKASYKKDGSDIQDYNEVIGENNKGKPLTYGKDSNDRNNKQNADIYGILRNKASRKNQILKHYKLVNYEDLVDHSDPNKNIENELSKDVNPRNLENAYIDFLEIKELEAAMMLEYDLAMQNFNEETTCTEWPQPQEPTPQDQ